MKFLPFELWSKSLKYRVLPSLLPFIIRRIWNFKSSKMLQILYVKKTLAQCYKFLHPWKKKPSVKIFENCSFPSRAKKKPTREKIRKSVREKFGLPVKSSKKVCVKATLPSVKKVEKRPKMAFTGTFDFHGKKKNAAIYPQSMKKIKGHFSRPSHPSNPSQPVKLGPTGLSCKSALNPEGTL